MSFPQPAPDPIGGLSPRVASGDLSPHAVSGERESTLTVKMDTRFRGYDIRAATFPVTGA